MTATISRTPLVGAVGGTSRFKLLNQAVGNAVRYYLTSKPTGSALVCLDDVDTTDPIARSKAQLALDGQANALLVPDVSGHYLVEAHQITVTHAIRTYNDQAPTVDTDNDFGAAPVVKLSDGDQAIVSRGQPKPTTFYDPLSASTDYLVAATLSKTIGNSPDTGVVSIVVDDTVESRLTGVAFITPSNTTLAKLAAASSDVVGAIDSVRHAYPEAFTEDQFNQNAIFLVTKLWNYHLASAAIRHIHKVADTRTVSTAAVVTLSDVLTKLAALETAYNAHRADTLIHYAADVYNMFPDGVSAAVDLPTLHLRLWWMWRVLVNGTEVVMNYSGVTIGALHGHVSDGNAHGDDTSRSGDGLAYTFRDFPATLEGCCDSVMALVALWNAHIAKSVLANPAHHATDTTNAIDPKLTAGGQLSNETAVKLINAIADSFDHHVANEAYSASTGAYAPAATAYHDVTNGLGGVALALKAPPRAGDFGSAVTLAERLYFIIVKHLNDAVAHCGEMDAPGTPYSLANVPNFMRIQAHWYDALLPASPAPKRWNVLETMLIRAGWKLGSAREKRLATHRRANARNVDARRVRIAEMVGPLRSASAHEARLVARVVVATKHAFFGFGAPGLCIGHAEARCPVGRGVPAIAPTFAVGASEPGAAICVAGESAPAAGRAGVVLGVRLLARRGVVRVARRPAAAGHTPIPRVATSAR